LYENLQNGGGEKQLTVPSGVVTIRASLRLPLYWHARKPKLPSKVAGAANENGTIVTMTTGRNFMLTWCI